MCRSLLAVSISFLSFVAFFYYRQLRSASRGIGIAYGCRSVVTSLSSLLFSTVAASLPLYYHYSVSTSVEICHLVSAIL